jgi:hypothetical protein
MYLSNWLADRNPRPQMAAFFNPAITAIQDAIKIQMKTSSTPITVSKLDFHVWSG